jgi:hypothetical protein
MPSGVVVEVKCRVEEGVVFMGVAFRELPVGRSRWRLSQSRDRGLQGSTHCGYCVHGSHLLPMDHDRRNRSTPATRCATGLLGCLARGSHQLRRRFRAGDQAGDQSLPATICASYERLECRRSSAVGLA